MSGPSQNGEASSHSTDPRRNRLAITASSGPPSSPQENQTASRSPLGHSAIAGLWLWPENVGPAWFGWTLTNGLGPLKSGFVTRSTFAGAVWLTSRALSGGGGAGSGAVFGNSPRTTRKPI